MPEHDKFWRHQEIVLTAGRPSAERKAVQRAAKTGELFKIRDGLYSSHNDESTWPGAIARNRLNVLAGLFPGAVISGPTAFTGGSPIDGSIFLIYKYTNSTELPGLKVWFTKGAPAQPTDMPYKSGELHFASEARQLLENLVISRSDPPRSAGLEGVKAKLQSILQVQGEGKLNSLRDQASVLAPALRLERQAKRLNELISQLLTTQPSVTKSRKSAGPVDQDRLALFGKLAETLRATTLLTVPAIAEQGSALINFAFLESYFSNYIEGTEFTIEEAREIAIEGRPPQARPKDAHDIVGIMKTAANPHQRISAMPAGIAAVPYLLELHGIIMANRPEVNPGQFKSANNQAGNTMFVHKDLVRGTLRAAADLQTSVPEGLQRALLAMFIVTEIHPYDDGNGRVSRLVMNAELSRCGLCRVIVPTLVRANFFDCLRALTRNGDPVPYVGFMQRMLRWTSGFDYAELDGLLSVVRNTNAFERDPVTHQLGFAAEASA